MNHRTSNPTTLTSPMSDTVFECVIPYITDPKDRASVSLVCKKWYDLDALTRKHITIAFCYTSTPAQLLRRFSHIESIKLKGKPRAAMFNLIPEDWGGYVRPWVVGFSRSFVALNSLHFRRMIVLDEDLELIGKSRGRTLQVLRLDKCSGFSTDGLLHITSSCRNLRTLYLEESSIIENGGEWLHELALHNKVLETLNFYMTELAEVSCHDLELIAKNCSSLVSVKISDGEILDLAGFFEAASALEEFGGGSFNNQPEMYKYVPIPPRICLLGLTYLGKHELPHVFPIASRIKKVDLLYALLDTEDHCLLIERCPNLEILETRNVIGDRGLGVLANFCKKMRRLRIERGADEQEMEDVEGVVSQTGLISLAEGCRELEYLAVYVTDITNGSLECMGRHLKNLRDFRLVLLEQQDNIADLPLDYGVQALLRGQHSQNVRWMLLGYVGESDAGLLALSKGCPKLQRLEMRGCYFSESALATAVLQLPSLRYLWVQGYRRSQTNSGLLAMARPFWNIELIPARRDIHADALGEAVETEQPSHILAYYSLAGQRTDFPDSVIPLNPVSSVTS
ncbi:Coronatine-insensitive protein 1 [Heracleum sosnowskyi]|uniref:Coronatine-insensitive protein 1 n=1 Tax=Heracleum sosnowskyi TaxID=360622 RepID=A0AAD8HE96_9APIA|nr:Coronatine-insensitive protein 1 [Heracleum sosnowskyi]